MRENAYFRQAERQETYWYYRARRRLAADLLRRYGARSGIRALDVGCGTGGNLSIFEPFEPELVVGLDLSMLALKLGQGRNRRAALVRGDVSSELPFNDGLFDVATIFHVLYHQWVEDDQAALARVRRVLRPGGLVLVTEPAFDVLRREIDEETMTRRRYTRRRFQKLADSTGFETLFASYFSSLAFLPALVSARLARKPAGVNRSRSEAVDLRPLPGVLNSVLFGIAQTEAKFLSAGIRLPFGVGIVAVLRRRG